MSRVVLKPNQDTGVKCPVRTRWNAPPRKGSHPTGHCCASATPPHFNLPALLYLSLIISGHQRGSLSSPSGVLSFKVTTISIRRIKSKRSVKLVSQHRKLFLPLIKIVPVLAVTKDAGSLCLSDPYWGMWLSSSVSTSSWCKLASGVLAITYMF